MAKILVTGATGFVGRHLIKRLKNHDITCLIIESQAPDFLKGTKIIHGSISNKDDFINAAKGQEVIINLAAPLTQINEINKEVIVNGTKNLLKAGKINKIKKIITLSSFAGYRKNLDSYGQNKNEADKILVKSDLSITILRPTMIYGKEGYAFNKLVDSIKKFPFIIPVVGDGKYRIQPAYVEDVVSAIIASIERRNGKVETFDLGGPYEIQYNEFIKKILKILEKKKMILHVPVKLILPIVGAITFFFKNLAWNTTTIKRMVEEVKLDIEKTKKELGIKITPYDEALKEIF